MRSAVFHDYFSTIGGGEQVAATLAFCLSAELITTECKEIRLLKELGITVRSLGNVISIPGMKQMSASWHFSHADLSKSYDFFIFSGNWAPHASKNHHPNIWYCHTPVRALYDLSEVFEKRFPFFIRPLFRLWSEHQRRVDMDFIANVDEIITNSKNTAQRISQYYGRDARVIYPAVDLQKFSFIESGNFWLAVNRLYPEKRIELQIEAFRLLPDESLVIVGGSGSGDHAIRYASQLNENIPSNVTIMGSVSSEVLIQLYGTCRGLICTAMDEDFGITPLEAMASGKPVIAVDEGGFRETVIHEKTGLLIKPTLQALIQAIHDIGEDPVRYRHDCIRRSQEFGGIDRFCREIREVVETMK